MGEIALIPSGKHHTGLQEKLKRQVLPLFGGYLLPFGQPYSDIITKVQKGGLVIAADGSIAASAEANIFAVGTRDTSPFEAAGVTVINLWKK